MQNDLPGYSGKVISNLKASRIEQVNSQIVPSHQWNGDTGAGFAHETQGDGRVLADTVRVELEGGHGRRNGLVQPASKQVNQGQVVMPGGADRITLRRFNSLNNDKVGLLRGRLNAWGTQITRIKKVHGTFESHIAKNSSAPEA